VEFKNSITTFIFLLFATLYLYVISTITNIGIISTIAKNLAIITFTITLIGLFIGSLSKRKSVIIFYYLGLFLIGVGIIIIQLITKSVASVIQYYFILAILIAMLLSLLDLRNYIFYLKRMINNQNIKINTLNKNKKKQNEKISSLENNFKKIQEKSDQKNVMIKSLKKDGSKIKKAKKVIEELQNKTENYKVKIKKTNKKAKKANEKLKTVDSESKKISRKLKRNEKELNKQEGLKKQYSKSLRNIRKKRKEDEELLIVSNDGKSVHRPKCITVRNIDKENRKLIKNWELAQKDGYKGCGLCKPHIKPKVIVKNKIKFKFVASKDSDKVHKAGCVITSKIERKDMEYFRTYKAALKKGFTACRVCNPEQ
jgi:myosin heavy subunit